MYMYLVTCTCVHVLYYTDVHVHVLYNYIHVYWLLIVLIGYCESIKNSQKKKISTVLSMTRDYKYNHFNL